MRAATSPWFNGEHICKGPENVHCNDVLARGSKRNESVAVYCILSCHLKLINNSSSQNKANHYREGGLEMWS